MKVKERNDPEVTKVIFKKVKSGKFKGDVDAFFPNHEANRGKIAGYSQIGQHFEADLGYFWDLAPAKPEEYAPLKKELESIGYKLRVMKKLQYSDLPWRGKYDG